jgi:thioredoxin 1
MLLRKEIGHIGIVSLVIITSIAVSCSKKSETSSTPAASPNTSVAAPAPAAPAKERRVIVDTVPSSYAVPPHFAGVRDIKSKAHFLEVVNGVADTLVIFELYADWCQPCKVLAPVIKELANKYYDKTWFYKINVDVLPELNKKFRPQGIPFVVFVKDGQQIEKFSGVQPKETYEQAILKYTGPVVKKRSEVPAPQTGGR